MFHAETLGEDQRRPEAYNRAKEARFSLSKNPSKNETLEKHCFFWLLMLYYKHSSLNGLGSPFGMETEALTTVALLREQEEASPPGRPKESAARSGVLATLLPLAPTPQW